MVLHQTIYQKIIIYFSTYVMKDKYQVFAERTSLLLEKLIRSMTVEARTQVCTVTKQ
jgi:hypothetical protein